MTADGSAKINFEGDTVAVGLQVTMTDPDGNELPVPDGDYTLEDGVTIEVVNSLVAEIKPADVVEEVVPAEMNEAPTTTPQVKSEKTTNEVFYQLSAEIGKIIENKFAELETKLSAKVENEIKLSSVTKAKPAVSKSYAEMTNLEKAKYNKTKAAHILRIDRKTLYNKLKLYDIEL